MFGYYFGLALRGLLQNVALTAPMIVIIGVGIWGLACRFPFHQEGLR